MWVSRRRRRYQEMFNSAALATNALAQVEELTHAVAALTEWVSELEAACAAHRRGQS